MVFAILVSFVHTVVLDCFRPGRVGFRDLEEHIHPSGMYVTLAIEPHL